MESEHRVPSEEKLDNAANFENPTDVQYKVLKSAVFKNRLQRMNVNIFWACKKCVPNSKEYFCHLI